MPWGESGGFNSCSFWGHKGVHAHSMFIAINRDNTEQVPDGFYTLSSHPSPCQPS